MMQISNDDSKKIERKTKEKNRRVHMKNLCYKLNSLVPSLSSQHDKLFTQESQFDHSIAYIEQLRKRIEVLKDKRNEALRFVHDGRSNNPLCKVIDDPTPPTVEVEDLNGGLRVLLISSLKKKIPFSEIINIVEDGGAEVVKGGYTTVADSVIYTLHAKARFMRLGIEVTSIHQKLQELVNGSFLRK
ncbi:transcription factor bHLH162-like [Bidens hawaiensis]|uniref:transcription factor bHLH162-like n=1 Tax=Bidens hawaiensis TaxID=980011 RepID=UPI00404B7B1E